MGNACMHPIAMDEVDEFIGPTMDFRAPTPGEDEKPIRMGGSDGQTITLNPPSAAGSTSTCCEVLHHPPAITVFARPRTAIDDTPVQTQDMSLRSAAAMEDALITTPSATIAAARTASSSHRNHIMRQSVISESSRSTFSKLGINNSSRLLSTRSPSERGALSREMSSLAVDLMLGADVSSQQSSSVFESSKRLQMPLVLNVSSTDIEDNSDQGIPLPETSQSKGAVWIGGGDQVALALARNGVLGGLLMADPTAFIPNALQPRDHQLESFSRDQRPSVGDGKMSMARLCAFGSGEGVPHCPASLEL